MYKPQLTIEQVKTKLAKYCAFQERCTAEVLKKIDSYELNEDQTIDLIRWLTKEKFLDDRRFAKQFVHGKFYSKQWGRIKIRYELRKKEIIENFIETALKEEINDENYIETVQKLFHKKWTTLGLKKELTVQKKIQSYLQQKGYEWEVINDVIQKYFNKK